jgi:hypothetical protein
MSAVCGPTVRFQAQRKYRSGNRSRAMPSCVFTRTPSSTAEQTSTSFLRSTSFTSNSAAGAEGTAESARPRPQWLSVLHLCDEGTPAHSDRLPRRAHDQCDVSGYHKRTVPRRGSFPKRVSLAVGIFSACRAVGGSDEEKLGFGGLTSCRLAYYKFTTSNDPRSVKSGKSMKFNADPGLTAAETAKFDVFLTVDQGIEY